MKNKESDAVCLLSFVLVWHACFLAYPLWYIPQPAALRPWLFVGILAVGAGLAYAFRFMTRMAVHARPATPSLRDDAAFWFWLFSGVSLLHLPFLNLPVISGLDMIDHASVPALVAAKIMDGVSAWLYTSAQPVFTSVFLIAAAFLMSSRIRAWTLGKIEKIALFFEARLWLLLALLALAAMPFAGLIYWKSLPDRFGDLDTLFRYPPISKVMLIPAYLVFGIHEWVGRAIQLAFFYAGAFYLYHISLMFGDRASARVSALLFLLLPPFFHYGNTHLIEGGTLFFFAATFYHWIAYLETRNGRNLALGTLFAVMGCLYKHPMASVIPAFALMLVYDAARNRQNLSARRCAPALFALAIPAIAMQAYLKLSSFNSDVPSQMAPPDWFRISSNLSAISQGATLPVAIGFLAGMIYLVCRPHKPALWYLLCWILPHLLLSSMSKVFMNVRQALPYHMGLAIALSLLLSFMAHGKNKWKSIALYAILAGYLAGACLLMSHPSNLAQVGRAMGDRSYITLSNWEGMYIPYGEVIQELQQMTLPGDVIYAPMGNEPSQFYIAQRRMWDRVYVRDVDWKPREEKSVESLLEHCREINAQWLVLPRGKWLYQYADPEIVEQLFLRPPPNAALRRVVEYGDVEVGIWKLFLPKP